MHWYKTFPFCQFYFGFQLHCQIQQVQKLFFEVFGIASPGNKIQFPFLKSTFVPMKQKLFEWCFKFICPANETQIPIANSRNTCVKCRSKLLAFEIYLSIEQDLKPLQLFAAVTAALFFMGQAFQQPSTVLFLWGGVLSASRLQDAYLILTAPRYTVFHLPHFLRFLFPQLRAVNQL